MLLGGGRAKNGLGEHRPQQLVDHLAGSRPDAVAVERLAPVPRGPQVEQHVARPGVESAHRLAGVEARDVRDPADVRDHAAALRRGETRGVECGGERRALPAGRDVAVAEVAHDRKPDQLGEERAVHELHRVAEIRTVADRLAMAADRRHEGAIDARRREQLAHRGGVLAAQAVGEERAARELVRARRGECQRLGADRLGIGGEAARDEPAGRAREIDQRRVDPVETRARHQPDVQVGHAGPASRGRRSSCARAARAARRAVRPTPGTRPSGAARRVPPRASRS